MKKVLLIIPAYNEAENIGRIVTTIINHYSQYDYIIINDGSTDNTAAVCRERGYHFLDLPINLGIGGAVQTGYRYAMENDYDIAVQIDGDGQHDIMYVKDLIAPIEKEAADVVIGSRFLTREGFQSSTVRRIGISFLSGLIKLCCGITVRDVTSGFRAVNKKFIAIYAGDYPVDYPEPEAIVAATMWRGSIQEVPVIMRERENGVSSINFNKSIYYMVKVTLAIIICRISFGVRRGVRK